MKIERCYDSHVHLLATGESLLGLDLSRLDHAAAVAQLKIQSHHFRGDWLTGFGWDQNKWPGQKFPDFSVLDQVFGDTPVNFTRADGHASWLNTAGLKKLGLLDSTTITKPDPVGGQILRDSQGRPTGILLDQAKIEADLAQPLFDESQVKKFLETGVAYFRQNGFTHIRDMSCTSQQWRILRELDQQKKLPLYILANFTCENLADLDRVFDEMNYAESLPSAHLRVGAVKVYCDGALGSEGALLTQNYQGSDSQGLRIWDLAELEKLAIRVFQNHRPLAIHTIGDLASLEISELLVDLKKKGISGEINFEHLELVDDRTIKNLKELNARVHFQPCHFLTDIRFLKKKIGPLYHKAFRWADLEEQGIRFQFGSDMPIESSSVMNNKKAIELASENQIPRFHHPFELYHQFPDPDWGKNCSTVFSASEIQILFDGQAIKISGSK